MIRSAAERTAINTPIQGTAADMIKLAMVGVHQALFEGGFKTKMILQVHDLLNRLRFPYSFLNLLVLLL